MSRRRRSDVSDNLQSLLATGCWKSGHADAGIRNHKLQQELDEANAEIKNLKAEHFGKQSEKGSSVDRSNRLQDVLVTSASVSQASLQEHPRRELVGPSAVEKPDTS